eukprot:gene8314-11248_t
MRIDLIEKFTVSNNRISSYVYVSNPNVAFESLYIGTETGQMLYFPFQPGQIPHNSRPITLTKDISSHHNAEVVILIYSCNKKLINSHVPGILFSGSLDRSIKVWNINNVSNPLMQTLIGHSGSITSIVDGNDGTILSCSSDGYVRMWRLQRNRSIMLNPFFECTTNICLQGLNKDNPTNWLLSMTISALGPWICYVSDSEGSIHLLKKAHSIENEVEKHYGNFMNALVCTSKWAKIHNFGIHTIHLISSENVLVTLSFDCSFKILDPANGQLLFDVSNNRRCMYTSLTWVQELSCIYLIDEFGILEVFNLPYESVVENMELIPVNQSRIKSILKSHSGGAISSISRFNHESMFLTIVSNNKRASSAIGLVGGNSSFKSKKSSGVLGDVIIWNFGNDVNCLEFKGHEGSIATICALVHSNSTPVETNTTNNNNQKINSDDIMDILAGYSETPVGPNDANQLTRGKGKSGSNRTGPLKISREEKLFFSAGGEDFTIRCWDEYDRSESYQFKCKAVSEVTIMLVLWDKSCIATGHENGTVCLWNADTGNKVSSRALHNTVSSLVEAKLNNNTFLIGADYSGRIAFWNLTLHSINPTHLQVESSFQGFHDADDPGILCLAYHEESNTIFSGGNDRAINFWRANSDFMCSTELYHLESLCFLKCTKSFLLSGDEGGQILLSRLVLSTVPSGSPALLSVAKLTLVCVWAHITPTRAITDIIQNDDGSKLYILQCGGIGLGRTKIWEVAFQHRYAHLNTRRHFYKRSTSYDSLNDNNNHNQYTTGYTYEELVLSAQNLESDEIMLNNSILPQSAAVTAKTYNFQVVLPSNDNNHNKLNLHVAIPSNGINDVTAPTSNHDHNVSQKHKHTTPTFEDILNHGHQMNASSTHHDGYRIFGLDHPDLYIYLNEIYSFNSDKTEICCCTLVMNDPIIIPPDDVNNNNNNNNNKVSLIVYVGTNSGSIFKYSLGKNIMNNNNNNNNNNQVISITT